MNTATPLLQCLDYAGSALGLLGAYTVASHGRFSRFGWCAFLLANGAYIALALQLGLHGLLIQQVGFIGSSLLGIYRAFGRTAGLRASADLQSTLPRALRAMPTGQRNPSEGESS